MSTQHTLNSIGTRVAKHHNEFQAFVQKTEARTDRGVEMVGANPLVSADRLGIAGPRHGLRWLAGEGGLMDEIAVICYLAIVVLVGFIMIFALK